MRLALKPHLLFAFLALPIAESNAEAARNLTIASFNIEWYGLGGDMSGTPADEYRDETIRTFIDRNLSNVDVIVFQEIVDTDRLANHILGSSRRCQSYDHDYEKHQSVVLCAKTSLRFAEAPGDDNFMIEGVAINDTKSRPALNVYVTDARGNPVLHVVGVHLKAYPYESPTRLQQTRAIASYLAEIGTDIPVVAIGDFNTYQAPSNRQEAHDRDLIEAEFSRGGIELKLAAHELVTFRKGRNQWQFDQLYYSNGAELVGEPTVLGPCNDATTEEANAYNHNVSDHCPLVVKLRLGGDATGE